MRLVYDPELDVATLVLDETGAAGNTHAEVSGVAAGTYVDAVFDSDGRLVGFEMLGAQRVLPPEVLAGAEQA